MSCPSQSEYQPCNSKFLLIISWTREFIRSKKLYGSVRCRLLFFLLWVRPRPKGAGTSQPSSQLVLTRKKTQFFSPFGRFLFFSSVFPPFSPFFFLSHPSPQFFQTLKTPNPRTFWKFSKSPRGMYPDPRPKSQLHFRSQHPQHPAKKKQSLIVSSELSDSVW